MGMDWGSVGAGVVGGFDRFLDTLSYQQKFEQDERKIANDARIRELMAEIRMMTAVLNNDRARDVATINAGSRTNVAGINADSRETVAGINAGSRESVANINAGSRERVASGNNQTQFNIASMFEMGRNNRWATPSGNVTAAQAGADRRTAATIGSRERIENLLEGGRNTRAGDANTLRVKEGDKNRAVERERIRNRSNPFGGVTFGGDDPTRELTEGTGRPTAEPIEVIEPPSDDPPLPSSPEKANDQIDRLGAQIDSLMNQIRSAPTAAQRNALRRQLKPVLEAYQRAGGK